MRMTLRCAHTMNFRFHQYVNEVRALTTTRYSYDMNASSARFVDAIQSRQLVADDPTTVDDESGEDEVLDLICSERWDTLWDHRRNETNSRSPLKRRLWLRPIETIRDALPRGDL